MTSNALINQIASIILDTHSHLYTKEEAFNKITESLKQKDGAIRYRQPLHQSRLLSSTDGRQLEEELNLFLSQLKEDGHELDDLAYQSHVFTNDQGQMQQKHSVLVVYKILD